MKSVHKLFLLLFAACMLLATQAQAGAILTLEPGESTVREFVLYDEFNPRQLGPMDTYLVVGKGDNETKTLLGDLTITLKPTVTKSFSSVVDYALIGFSYPFGGKPQVFNMKSSAPLTLTKTVKMKAVYGLVLVGAYIKTISGDVNLPVQFGITFSWAQAK